MEGDVGQRNRQPKIIIIGAGIAGIAAGKYLVEEGFRNFVILEASSRTGGRIWSIPVDDNGGRAEMGANWIHGIDRNPIYQIASDNKLLKLRSERSLAEKNVYLCESNHGEIPDRVVSEVDFRYGQMIQKCEGYYQDGMPTPEENDSVGSELDRLISESVEAYTGKEKRDRELVYHHRRLLECCISGCDTMYDVSLSQFGSYEELPGIHYTIPRGFNAILDIIRRDIPEENIKLNTPVRTIHYGDEKPASCTQDMVCVECENGDILTADHVILTVSVGVLKSACDRMFNPRLSDRKRHAIDNLGYGVVNKVILIFRDRFFEPSEKVTRIHLAWDPEVRSDEDLRNRWFRKIYSLEFVHENVIVGWLSGKEAIFMESLTEEEIGEDMIKIIKKFLHRENIPSLVKVIRTRWYNNPHTRGSYSFISVGSSQEDILALRHPVMKTLDDTIRKPVIQFAGEATHPTFYSTTHGALQTGYREAARVVRFWKPEDEAGAGVAAMRYHELGLSSDEDSHNEGEEDSGDEIMF